LRKCGGRGADGKTLYLTADKALYSLDMNLPGYFD